MAKQSAADKLTARIDADVARIYQVANYVGGDATEALRSRIDSDLKRLNDMREYVTSDGDSSESAAPKPKRTRRKRAGLPEPSTEG